MTSIPLLLSMLFAMIGKASLNILAKLGTQDFVEEVLTDVLLWAGEKLAPMTTNELDDRIVAEMKKKLGR